MAIPYTTGQSSNMDAAKKPTVETAFILDFVRMCFTEDLSEVDFTQSLTAMRYLAILETRRRNEFSAACQRLGINVEALERDRPAFKESSPEIYEWFCTMESKGKRVESLYTQVYAGLRRWTLINEMRLTPFNKHNCITMLNTLYPPTYAGDLPTSQLTENTLNAQRNAFFRYIQAVEKSGKDVLINLEQSSRRVGDANGWPVVRDIVDVYLVKSNSLIDECQTVKNAKEFVITNKEKRTDSGVSFASSTFSNFSMPDRKQQIIRKPSPVVRPSTSMGTTNTTNTTTTATIITTPPMEQIELRPATMERKDSKFERFTRRLKSRSADRSQSPPQVERGTAPVEKQAGSLRKMKSTSGLRDGRHSRDNSTDRTTLPQFVIDDAQRELLIRQAQQDKANNVVKRRPSPSNYATYRPKAYDTHLTLPEESSPTTSCRITRVDQGPSYHDPYRLPSLTLPSLRV